MCKFFKLIDLFGTTKGISYEGSDTYKTNLGAVFTIIYIAVMILLAFYYYFEWQEAEPSISQGFNREFGEASLLKVSSNDLVAAFSLYNKSKSEFMKPDEYPGFVNIQWAVVFENEVKVNGADFVDCSKFDSEKPGAATPKVIDDRISILKGGFARCLKPDLEIVLKGQQYSPKFSYLTFEFSKCSQNCDPDIDAKLSNIEIDVYFVEGLLDLQNRYDPLFYKFNSDLYADIANGESIDRKIFLEKLVVNDDQGSIRSVKKTYETFRVKNLLLNTHPNGNNAFPLASFQFQYSNEKLQMNRSYEKLQDLLGKLGGFSAIISFAIIAVYTCFREINLKLYIFNNTIFHAENAKYGRKVGTIETISFYFWRYCKCCRKGFSPRRRKLAKLYFEGGENFEENMDVVKLNRNYSELAILKQMLLNKNQRILMEKAIGYTSLVNFDEELDEEKLGKARFQKIFKEAEEYLQKDSSNDDVERKVNRFLKEILDQGIQAEIFGSCDLPRRAKEETVGKPEDGRSKRNKIGVKHDESDADILFH